MRDERNGKGADLPRPLPVELAEVAMSFFSYIA
jgi:hypothetical protein